MTPAVCVLVSVDVSQKMTSEIGKKLVIGMLTKNDEKCFAKKRLGWIQTIPYVNLTIVLKVGVPC
jgi:hypothetical protein